MLRKKWFWSLVVFCSKLKGGVSGPALILAELGLLDLDRHLLVEGRNFTEDAQLLHVHRAMRAFHGSVQNRGRLKNPGGLKIACQFGLLGSLVSGDVGHLAGVLGQSGLVGRRELLREVKL